MSEKALASSIQIVRKAFINRGNWRHLSRRSTCRQQASNCGRQEHQQQSKANRFTSIPKRVIRDIDQQLDGVMGVAIEDLTTGENFFLHEDEVFAQASSIKITVLANLNLQAQQGKLKLTDP